MSESMQKMWISIFGMFLLAIAMVAIYLSRYKFNNRFLKIITAFSAWICLLLGGFIVFIVVLSGPTY